MKIGILGTGSIANTLAETMKQMEEVECYAVASRDLKKAEAFAEKHGFSRAFGSYEELAEDSQVELVYIATPHSHHYENMKLCMERGKPVLCEKAFTMNSAQAKEIQRLSERKHVMAAEAIWTRYMPSRRLIDEMIASGMIGKASMLTANLSYVICGVDRILDPNLAGGALLDVGVYPIHFALMHFGDEIEKIESSVQFTETGVDGMETITIFYKGGRMASLTAGIYGRSDRKGIIYGDKGYLIVENINNPKYIEVYDLEDRLMKRVEVPPQISGYEYEIRECIQTIEKGEINCPSIPLSDSIRVMEVADELRLQWGLVYPGEKVKF